MNRFQCSHSSFLSSRFVPTTLDYVNFDKSDFFAMILYYVTCIFVKNRDFKRSQTIWMRNILACLFRDPGIETCKKYETDPFALFVVLCKLERLFLLCSLTNLWTFVCQFYLFSELNWQRHCMGSALWNLYEKNTLSRYSNYIFIIWVKLCHVTCVCVRCVINVWLNGKNLLRENYNCTILFMDEL